MQAIKALFGMASSGCHSVWCWCTSATQHITPTKELTTWASKEAWYKGADCRLKTLADCCMLAHYSLGIVLGTGFTPVHCVLCGYKRDEEQEAEWRADLCEFNTADEATRKKMMTTHNEKDVDAGDLEFKKHHHQLRFTPPLSFLDI